VVPKHSSQLECKSAKRKVCVETNHPYINSVIRYKV